MWVSNKNVSNFSTFNFANFSRSSTAALASDLALTPCAQQVPCVAVLQDREIGSVRKTGKENDKGVGGGKSQMSAEIRHFTFDRSSPTFEIPRTWMPF
jgi:hypothetical protein